MEARYVTHSGDDLLVVNAARVSFAKRSGAFTERDAGLLRYLAEHGHWTPFAHPQITLHLKAPIFVRTQCFKHKVGFVENEISRRYVDDPPEFFLPAIWRGRALTAKQGSDGEVGQQATATALADYVHGAARLAYQDMLAAGVAPEQARLVLPQSTMTEWFWTGSLAAWARFYRQRTGSDAQAETAELARRCGEIIEPLFPASWRELMAAPSALEAAA